MLVPSVRLSKHADARKDEGDKQVHLHCTILKKGRELDLFYCDATPPPLEMISSSLLSLLFRSGVEMASSFSDFLNSHERLV